MSVKHSALLICLLGFISLGAVSGVYGQQRSATQDAPPQYSMGALFPAPPFHFRGDKVLTVVVKTTPEILRELVPQPLVPNPDNLLVIYIGSLNASGTLQTSGMSSPRTVSYLEAGILVPAIFPKTKALGNYVVALYLDTPVGIAAGREIWGFPKKDAKLTFSVKDGQVSGTVERLGTVLLKVNGKMDKKLESLPDKSNLPLFVEKIVPSARRNAPPDVWQLVSAMETDNKTNELRTCTASVELNSGPEDPVGRIRVLGVARAQFATRDFTLDYGEILHDYLSQE